MNIKISDKWVRKYLNTGAKPKTLARALSLSSASVERVEKIGGDTIYDIEVTTNRVDLMSIVGIARDAAAVLPEFDIPAKFTPPVLKNISPPAEEKIEFGVTSDPNLVRRVMAVVMEVKVDKSPEFIQKRLENTGIRALNNVIDITNYIMREIGHPAHAFDYDRLGGTHLTITKSQKGSTITTLDKKSYLLTGGDIVAVNDKGDIIDLLGIMGLENSVVTKKTKKVVLFINNNNPDLIRRTSLTHGIRTEAAILNEKNLDPELAEDALKRGVELYQKYANAKVISDVIDIYPKKAKTPTVQLNFDKIESVIGIEIPKDTTKNILKRLGFNPKIKDEKLSITVPTWREKDISIAEDVIEEVARVYGYHKIPSQLPNIHLETQNIHDEFYWEKTAKQALKNWGATEVYTYSMVGENLLEVAPDNAISLANPLTQDHVYMRTTLIPSLLRAISENSNRDKLMLFEIAKTYHKKGSNKLPDEILTLAFVWKEDGITFYHAKGIIESLANTLGISNLKFRQRKEGGIGADILLGNENLGNIEVLEKNLVNFELNFSQLSQNASTHKKYTPLPKYPPVLEDVTLSLPQDTQYSEIITAIKNASTVVKNVDLIDTYENKKTFRLTYRDKGRSLSANDVEEERKKIYKSIKESLHAEIDE